MRCATLMLLFALPLSAQEALQERKPGQPEVRLNILNVCNPGPDAQKDMQGALQRVPQRPAFAADFEIARGRTTMPDGPSSKWVRIRKEFAAGAPFSTVQYTFSADPGAMTETLVFRVRDPKDVMQISMDDKITGASDAAVVLNSDTPVSHVKVERFGKSSLALARCEADQTAYEPLFRAASQLMSRYRALLAVRRTVAGDLRQLGVIQPASPRKTASPKPR